MFGTEQDWTRGFEVVLSLKAAMHQIAKPIFESHGGKEMEENFFVFDTPAPAVKSCIEIRDAVRAYNAAHDAVHHIILDGFGVHCSDMLIVPGTDIHWGDAVNTASKLGEDLAQNEELLISPEVMEKIRGDELLAGYTWETKVLHASGVDLTSFVLVDKQ
jgi:hypothetical protein